MCIFFRRCCWEFPIPKNRGDRQKKKFVINNTIEALILLKEGYQFLLRLHVPCRGKVGRPPKAETKKCHIEGFSEFTKIVFIFSRGCWRVLLQIKRRGKNRGSKMKLKNVVWESCGTLNVWGPYGSCLIPWGEYLVDAWWNPLTKLQNCTLHAVKISEILKLYDNILSDRTWDQK